MRKVEGLRKGDSGNWIIDVAVDNQRVQRSSGTADLAAAKRLRDKIRSELWEQAKLGAAPKITWAHAVREFITQKAREGRKATATTELRLEYFAGLNARDLATISTATIAELIQKLPAKLTNSTRNRYMAAASGVLKYAASKGWIAKAVKIDWLPEPEGRIRYLTREEAARLIKAINAPHLRHMVIFSLATGLRRANVTGLKWENVSIPHARAIVWGEDTKSGRRLPIPLNDDAIQVLRERAKLRDADALKGCACPYVFTYRGARIFHTNSTAWRNALAKASITNFRWHDLRHTWATWHAIANTPPRVLQQLGGWASFTMVERYGHIPAEYAQQFAGNAALTILPKTGTVDGEVSVNPENLLVNTTAEAPVNLGWLMGLEPTTTGITNHGAEIYGESTPEQSETSSTCESESNPAPQQTAAQPVETE